MTGPTPPERDARALLDEVIRDVTGLATELDANFFEVGVTSAQLVQVHERLQSRLARPVPVVDLFRYPNRRTLARYLAGSPAVPTAQTLRVPPPAGRGLTVHDRRALRARIRDRGGNRVADGAGEG